MDKNIINFIKKALRRSSYSWEPIRKTKNKSRRKYVGNKKRQKYEYKCNFCNNYFPSTKVQVDHIIPVGSFKTEKELAGYINRLLCEEDGLQVLCLKCHKIKTINDSRKA